VFVRELADVVRHHEDGRHVLVGRLGGRFVRVAHVGIGAESAALRTDSLLRNFHPEWLVAAGFGGALDESLAIGDVVIDRRGVALEPLPPIAREGGIFTASHALEAVEEKRRARNETGSLCVDMETAAISEICKTHGVPVIAVRAISDQADQPLPVPLPAWYDIRMQRPRPAVLVGYLATHPGAVLPFFRFVRRLPVAQRNLARALRSLCAEAAILA
jgi:adenosylhomocysteine nucleosidase